MRAGGVLERWLLRQRVCQLCLPTGGATRCEWRSCSLGGASVVNTSASPWPCRALQFAPTLHKDTTIEFTRAGLHLEDFVAATANQPCSPALAGSSTPARSSESFSTRRRAWTRSFASQHVATSPAGPPSLWRWRRGGWAGHCFGCVLCGFATAVWTRATAALLLSHLMGS